jgi:hypothetical protein
MFIRLTQASRTAMNPQLLVARDYWLPVFAVSLNLGLFGQS